MTRRQGWVRRIGAMAVAVSLVTGLGCAGLGEQMLKWTGSEIQVGANAVHPADFPLPPPPTGTIVSSAKVNLGPVRTSTVVYQVPGRDTEAMLAPYEQKMKEAGLTTRRESRDGTQSLIGEKGTTNWSVSTSPDGQGTMLVLVIASAEQ